MNLPWSVDYTRCARCGHADRLHKSRILHPRPGFGQVLARPCTRVTPRAAVRDQPSARWQDIQSSIMYGCGCPDFVVPAPLWIRALNVFLDWWLVTVLTLLVMGFVISLVIEVLS